MSIAGHLAGVTEDRFGAELTADLAIDDTVIHVDKTVSFDEEQGGFLLIGGVKLPYAAFDDPDDDDPDVDGPTELTLTTPSTVAASEGDPVWAFDPTTGADDADAELIALVTIDDRDDGNAIPARIRAGLTEQLDSDFETYLGKAVELEVVNGDLVLVDILGSKATGALKFDQDETVAAGAGGIVTLDLKYIPVENSEHLYVGGVYQRGAVWTRDRWTVSIPDEESRLRAGVKVAMEYAYRDPAVKPATIYSAPVSHARSGTWNAYPTSFLTSQALPVGTVVGDLLVVVAAGEGDHTISDTRMTVVADEPNLSIAVGYATDLSALVCRVGGADFPIDQFAGLEILAVHGNGTDPLEYDPTKIGVSYVGAAAALNTIAGAGNGAVLAIASGVINGITIDMATYCPGYTNWGGEIAAPAVLGNFGYSSNNSPVAQTNPTNAPTLAAVIGLK